MSQVPAGTVLEFTPEGSRAQSWWQLAEAPEWRESEAELAEQCRALLLDAVGRRLAVAPRPAFTLSGGMDSSSALYYMSRASGAPVNYSIPAQSVFTRFVKLPSVGEEQIDQIRLNSYAVFQQKLQEQLGKAVFLVHHPDHLVPP